MDNHINLGDLCNLINPKTLFTLLYINLDTHINLGDLGNLINPLNLIYIIVH